MRQTLLLLAVLTSFTCAQDRSATETALADYLKQLAETAEHQLARVESFVKAGLVSEDELTIAQSAHARSDYELALYAEFGLVEEHPAIARLKLENGVPTCDASPELLAASISYLQSAVEGKEAEVGRQQALNQAGLGSPSAVFEAETEVLGVRLLLAIESARLAALERD